MEKIKITKEQEEAFKKLGGGFMTINQKLISFIDDRPYTYEELEPLNKLTEVEFMKILCGWYEVEQPFKVGDWIFDKSNDAYGQITHVDEDSYSIKGSIFSIYINYAKGHFEKVTEPWKIMLLELGRDKPEFKEGDVVGTEGSIAKHYNHSGSLTLEWARENKIKYFYPVESRIEVKQ